MCVCVCVYAVTEPVSEAVLEPLIHLLVSSDLEVQKAASHALSNLALRGAGKGLNMKGRQREKGVALPGAGDGVTREGEGGVIY